MAIWGMAIAYRRGVEGEEDKMRAHELEQVSKYSVLYTQPHYTPSPECNQADAQPLIVHAQTG